MPVVVRFAHEMNGSWYPWGQQPAAYVEAFRRVAGAVHTGAPGSAVMWAPNYGGGYPFTGGTHAAGLFALDGRLLVAREDVGRHNAVDKVLGWALQQDRLPLRDAVLVVSSRVSYEIVLKAAAAGVPILAAVSAPSSLALEAAQSWGVCVAAFVRDAGCNVYTYRSRVRSRGDDGDAPS